jgi:selenocysteine lyase/cysteine desulfurase
MSLALADAGKTFPALERITFLDAACVSLVSRPVAEAVRSFLDRCQLPEAADASQHFLSLDASRQAAVAEAARLLNAEPSQIALIESTTQGLNVAAGILPLRAGDQVLIADTDGRPGCRRPQVAQCALRLRHPLSRAANSRRAGAGELWLPVAGGA